MASDIKFVFIVTGKDASFTEMAGHRARELIRKAQSKSPGAFDAATLRFVHFNFRNDKVEFYEFDRAKEPDWAGKFPWRPLGAASLSGDPLYDPKTFVSASLVPDTMSIVDVYRSIRGAPASSVLELSIFSHAFAEGPVLVNTFDRVPPPFPDGSPQRTWTDPIDRDGRARTDFFPNMGEDPNVSSAGPVKRGGKNALNEFKAAFDSRGSFRVYGCNVQDVVVDPGDGTNMVRLASAVRQVLHQAYVLPVDAARSGGTGSDFGEQLRKGTRPAPDTPITLDMEREFRQEERRAKKYHDLGRPFAFDYVPLPKLRELHYGIDDKFFKSETGMKLKRQWREVIQFVARRVMDTYVFKAADATGITCYGAMPGTGGGVEDRTVPDRQMRVCREEGGGCSKDESYRHYLQFYVSFMDVSCTEPDAPIQRNYGILDAATVAKLKEHAANG